MLNRTWKSFFVFRNLIWTVCFVQSLNRWQKKTFKTILKNQQENFETFKITNLKLMKMLVIRQERPFVCKLQMNIVQN